MSRPICFHCGRQLMYVNGKPVFEVYVDPIGAEHKLHKDCFKRQGYADKHQRPWGAREVGVGGAA